MPLQSRSHYKQEQRTKPFVRQNKRITLPHTGGNQTRYHNHDRWRKSQTGRRTQTRATKQHKTQEQISASVQTEWETKARSRKMKLRLRSGRRGPAGPKPVAWGKILGVRNEKGLAAAARARNQTEAWRNRSTSPAGAACFSKNRRKSNRGPAATNTRRPVLLQKIGAGDSSGVNLASVLCARPGRVSLLAGGKTCSENHVRSS
jgi:hypothetical protein